MAGNKFDLDRIDLDDFDLGDFEDLRMPGEADDRTAVTRIKDSFIAGTTETLKSPGYYVNIMRKALPTEYGDALAEAEQLHREVGYLYDKSLEKLKPEMDLLKRQGRRLIPTAEKYLPKHLADRVKALLEEDYDYRGVSEEKQREDQREREMGEIFKLQLEEGYRQHEETKEQLEFNAAIDRVTAKNQMEQLLGIHKGIGRLVGYKEQIETKYQQKSLELQYRQLFTSQDTLSQIKQGNEELLLALKDITKNTGLPDAVKLRKTEAFGVALRERFIRSTQDRMMSPFAGLADRVTRNLNKKVGDTVESAKDILGTLLSGGGEESGAEVAGYTGSGLFTGVFGDAAGEWIGDKMKFKDNPKVRDIAAKIGGGLNNVGGLKNSAFLQDEAVEFDDDGNVKFNMKNFVKGQIRDLLENPRGDVRATDLFRNSKDPGHLTNLAVRSLEEIMPGYLGMILRELTIARTGDVNSPLTVYNLQRGKFSTDAVYKADIMNRIDYSHDFGGMRDSATASVDALDKEGKLSETAREALTRQMIHNARDNTGLHLHKLADEKSYHTTISTEDRRELADFFKETYKVGQKSKLGEDLDLKENFSRAASSYGDIARSVPEFLDEIELQLSMGNRQLLEEMGLMKRERGESVIDYENVVDWILKHSGGSARETSDKTSTSAIKALRDALGRFNYRYFAGDDVSDSGSSGLGAEEIISQGESILDKAKGYFASKDIGRISASAQESAERMMGEIEKLQQSTYGSKRYNRLKAQIEKNIGRIEDDNPVIAKQAKRLLDRIDKAMSSGRMTGDSPDIESNSEYDFSQPTMEGEAIPNMFGRNRESVSNTGTSTETMGHHQSQADISAVTSQDTVDFRDTLLQRLVTMHTTQMEGNELLQALLETGINMVTSGEAPDGRKYGLRYGIRKGLGGLFHGAGSLIKGMGKATLGLGTMYGKIFGGIGAVGLGAGKWLGERLGRGRFSDIYVKGSKVPVLYAKGLKRGEYIDKNTGKVIKQLKDITGPVVEASDPTNEVLTLEDFQKGLYDIQGKPILKNVANKLIDIYGAAFSPITAVMRLGGKVIGSVTDAIFSETDLMLGDGSDKPVLYVKVMKDGGYFNRSNPSKPLKSFKDISDDVIDRYGETVVSLKDIHRFGLVDMYGRKPTTLGQKAWGLARGAIGLGVSAVKGIAKYVAWSGKKLFGAGKGLFNFARKHVGGFIGRGFGLESKPEEMMVATNMETNQILTAILHLLDERMPGKKDIFDTDNDGDRDGSWQDQLKKKGDKTTQEKASEALKEEKGGKGILGSIGAMLGGLFGKKEEPEEEESSTEEAANTIIGSLGDSDDEDEDDGKKKKKKKKGKKGAEPERGRMGKTWDKVKGSKFGKFFGKLGLGGIAGRIGGATALRTVGTLAAGAAMVGVGGMVGGYAGAAIAGIGAILASPVLLTAALAVGAAAIIGYAGYKIYKALAGSGEGDLLAVRFMLYGVNPKDDKKAGMVMELEQRLESKVSFTGTSAKVDITDQDLEEIMGVFQIEANNRDGMEDWMIWFEKRFKPVYLSYKAAVYGTNPELSLADADKRLSPTDKITIIQKTRSLVYTVAEVYETPFGDGNRLITPPGGMNSVIDQVIEALKKKGETDKKSDEEKTWKDTAKGIATMGLIGMVPGAGLLKLAYDKFFKPKPVEVDTKRQAAMLGALEKELNSGVPTGTPAIVISISGPLPMMRSKRQYESIDFIRYKCYGLIDLQVDKIRQLQDLEADVAESVSYTHMKSAEFTGSMMSLLEKHLPIMGGNPKESTHVTAWGNWFSKRFLPVYLSYVTAIRQFSEDPVPDTAISRLKAEQKVEVAEAMAKSVGIWTVGDSPWPGYAVNMDRDTVTKNIDALKRAVKDQTLTDLDQYREAKANAEASATPGAVDDRKVVQYHVDTSGTSTTNVSEDAIAKYNASQSTTAGASTNQPQSVYNPSTNAPTGGKVDFIMPAQGRISSEFGMRKHPIHGTMKNHSGIDIAAANGTPVYAAADGVITRAEFSNSYGNVIYIRHPNNMETRYAHLARFGEGIGTGKGVRQGDLIGYVGNTGASKGNHLHFEVRQGQGSMGVPVNPLSFINKSTAAPAVKELEEEKQALKKDEQVVDTKDNMEGVDTVAATTTGKTETSKPQSAMALEQQWAASLPKTATSNMMPASMETPSPGAAVDSKATQWKEEQQRKVAQANASQRAIENKERHQLDNTSNILKQSLNVQISMDNKLTQVIAALNNISKINGGSSNSTPETPKATPAVARPTVTRSVKPDPVSLAQRR